MYPVCLATAISLMGNAFLQGENLPQTCVSAKSICPVCFKQLNIFLDRTRPCSAHASNKIKSSHSTLKTPLKAEYQDDSS